MTDEIVSHVTVDTPPHSCGCVDRGTGFHRLSSLVGLDLVPVSEGVGGLVRPVSPGLSVETDPGVYFQQ